MGAQTALLLYWPIEGRQMGETEVENPRLWVLSWLSRVLAHVYY